MILTVNFQSLLFDLRPGENSSYDPQGCWLLFGSSALSKKVHRDPNLLQGPRAVKSSDEAADL